ncbi:MAG: Wzy polymerase domain-containing protein [Gallionella sp.]
MQLNFLRPLRASHFTLTLVGLLWLVPFLHYRHENPLTTFHQEWWAFFLGLLAALSLLIGKRDDAPLNVPRMVVLPLGLVLIALLQMALGDIAYVAQGKLFILYFLFAALLMGVGASLRERLGLGAVASVLAIFALLAAELNAAIGVIQHFHLHTPLDTVIVSKAAVSLYGNLGQPNHYANFLALGLAALGLRYQQGKLNLATTLLLLAPLLFVLTLSGSRSSWLYLLFMAMLGWGFALRDAQFRRLKIYGVLLLAGFALMHLVVQLPIVANAGDQLNTLNRLFAEDVGTRSIRAYLWQEGIAVFMQTPVLGVGLGQFALQHFQLQPQQGTGVAGLYTHAHNLIFQLAAETGSVGVALLLASLGAWLWSLRRVSWTAAHWWLYAALGVLAIHSLLEYPLWYSYFLALAALLIGLADERHFKLRQVGLRSTLFVVIVLGAFSLWQFERDYQRLKTAIISFTQHSEADHAAEQYRDALLALDEHSLLHGYAMFYLNPLLPVDAQNLSYKLQQSGQLLRFLPTADVAYKYAFLLAQDDQLVAAKVALTQAIWSYPQHAPVQQLLSTLAANDPAHFAALLEFATQKQQEYDLAVRL